MGRGCTSRVIMNAAIKTDGRLYTTGDNKKGQLGLGRKSIVTTKAGKVIDYKTNFNKVFFDECQEASCKGL